MRAILLGSLVGLALLWACAEQRLSPIALSAAMPGTAASVSEDALPISIVPQPHTVVRTGGIPCRWPAQVTIRAVAAGEREVGRLLQAVLLSHRIRSALSHTERAPFATLVQNGSPDRAMGSEGYLLRIDGRSVTVRANTPAGLFYGVQTLDQLIEPRGAETLSPAVEIHDSPRFPWRGIHLDVSRHFFSVAVVKQYIALAAHFKLNTFHWHLSDDQGWRLEVKRYPNLAKVGACNSDGCNYYTQAQIRDIVDFAKQHYVEIVPELDIPGHSTAALRAYPALGCGASDLYCPSEATFVFLERVLSEVMSLFPGRYVHLGGDEVEASEWSGDTVAAIMQAQHIATLADVETYVLRRLTRYLAKHGRTAAVWDDAVRPGLPGDALVMAWRGPDVGLAALNAGHAVVMSPDGPLYFDAFQGDAAQEPSAMRYTATLQQVYDYEPAPSYVPLDRLALVRGAQANVWTEQIPTPEHLFYMLLPRELALAELTWSMRSRRDWGSFRDRLPQQFAWLTAHGFNFRVPEPSFSVRGGVVKFYARDDSLQAAEAYVESSTAEITISAPIEGRLRYTLDGMDPTATAHLYDGPIHVALDRSSSVTIRARTFFENGDHSTVSELLVRRASRATRTGRQSFDSWDALGASRRPDLYIAPSD